MRIASLEVVERSDGRPAVARPCGSLGHRKDGARTARPVAHVRPGVDGDRRMKAAALERCAGRSPWPRIGSMERGRCEYPASAAIRWMTLRKRCAFGAFHDPIDREENNSGAGQPDRLTAFGARVRHPRVAVETDDPPASRAVAGGTNRGRLPRRAVATRTPAAGESDDGSRRGSRREPRHARTSVTACVPGEQTVIEVGHFWRGW